MSLKILDFSGLKYLCLAYDRIFDNYLSLNRKTVQNKITLNVFKYIVNGSSRLYSLRVRQKLNYQCLQRLGDDLSHVYDKVQHINFR